MTYIVAVFLFFIIAYNFYYMVEHFRRIKHYTTNDVNEEIASENYNHLFTSYNNSSHDSSQYDMDISKYSTLGTAYVITLKNYLTHGIVHAAKSCGFEPQLIYAIQPFKEIFQSRENLTRSCVQTRKLKDGILLNHKSFLSLTEISLICSHRFIIEKIASESTKDNQWSLILEEDARLHPSVSNAYHQVNQTLMIPSIIKNGFLYFGLCGGYCRESSHDGILGHGCFGHCTHAYAITKKRAKTLFRDIYYHNEDGKFNSICEHNMKGFCPIDQAYIHYFGGGQILPYSKDTKVKRIQFPSLYTPQADVIGWNIHAIDKRYSHHNGLMYQQDSIALRTNPLKGNKFLKLICYHMNFDTEFHAIGYDMFKYATLVGLCISRKATLGSCAGIQFHSSHNDFISSSSSSSSSSFDSVGMINQSSYMKRNQFFNSFHVPHTSCMKTTWSYTEKLSSYFSTKGYDISIFTKPSGTKLDGKFLSYRYFQNFASQLLRKRLFTFSKSIQMKSERLLKEIIDINPIMSWESLPLACISFFKPYHHEKLDHMTAFMLQMIEWLKRKHNKLILLILYDSHSGNSLIKNYLENITFHNDIKTVVYYAPTVVAIRTLSLCPNIILPPHCVNSWWGAYLADEKANVFITSNHSHIEAKSYYLPSWNRI